MTFVHANFAAMLDKEGFLRYGVGASCALDLQRTHELRETYPAIAVGRRTLYLDHPRLTVRSEGLGREPYRQPKRFVLTRRREFHPPSGYAPIICSDGDLKKPLSDLEYFGIGGILIEAGPVLLNAALEQDVLSALTIYLRGPKLEDLLPAMHRLVPSLPRCYQVGALGEGHVLNFDMLARRNPRDPCDFASTPIITKFGRATLYTYRDVAFGREHGALVYGDPSAAASSEPPLVRIHSECWTSALMESLRCECQRQLEEAHNRISAEGRGILILHNAEGRGIGRMNKTHAYRLQELHGLDTMAANLSLGLPVDAREYFSAAHMLGRLGVKRVRLLTNGRDKEDALTQVGVEVVERIPLGGFCSADNVHYLAKKVECGHHPQLLETAGRATAGLHDRMQPNR